MNKFFLALFAIVLAVSLSTSAQDNKKGTQETKEKKVEVVKSDKLNTVCPVSGEDADSKITADYNGKKVALCCKTCLKKFQKDPEKYMKKFEQKENK